MRHLRQQASWRAGVWFFVALALVPLALSGHTHANDTHSSRDACAVCVATHHAPAASLPRVPRIAPVLHVSHLAAPYIAAPAQLFQPFKAGRAPPASSAPSIA